SVRARKAPPKPARRAVRVSRENFFALQERLREAQETLDAIRNGEVDAVVVSGARGNQIYSLTGADQPYRVYVERMQEGAVTISRSGLILYANQRFADMVDRPLERVISAGAADFLTPGAWKHIHSVFKEKGEVVKCETHLQPPDRPYLPVILTASRLPLEGQDVLCLVVTDLSAQKQNEELRLAKEVAEKANAAKDAFLAALSHELRTPLNPILLLASESARDPELPPHVRAEFTTIRDNIELEARLIDDLLDLNRIAHGKLALHLEIVDGIAVLKRAISMVDADLKRKGIALEMDFQAAQCELAADATRLQQVFWNILKNAVKFTPERGRIRLNARTDRPTHSLVVTVSDSGIGMTPAELQRIFDAFVQGEHARGHGAHKFGGLGLGLAISRMLIRMHDGSIDAHSEGAGKGATFTVRLPIGGSVAGAARHPLPARAAD
ncbi:MAG TPA: PAS domain-containing sensor histidine kinase, partial [Verrucomicrobiae bacterium]|nr:PAS domain-containing sensor histidine kinase [Verrucomicrobiae bacterium]